jgi:hypothetical protein
MEGFALELDNTKFSRRRTRQGVPTAGADGMDRYD